MFNGDNFNLREFLGNAVSGIISSLAQIGGLAWAAKWISHKLTDAAYNAWLKDWVKSTMAWLNDKVMGVLDAVLNGVHNAALPVVGGFVQDIVAYMRNGREAIQQRVKKAYKDALAIQAEKEARGEKSTLYVVGHSLGGLLAYDLVTNRGGTMRDDSGAKIDKLITFGSQVALFHEIDPDKALRPDADKLIDLGPFLEAWDNFYHEMDFLGFSVNRVFKVGDNGLSEDSIAYTGLVRTTEDGDEVQIGVDFKDEGFNAHSGYWRDSDFLPKLKASLSGYC